MTRNRLEAFSDGVIAILITIMVLELHPPHGVDLASLAAVLPSLLGYLLSFVYIGIYWNNHHHMLHLVDEVTGGILWANLHLLFWLSLFPFATAWMSQSGAAAVPVAAYGAVMLLAAAAYTLLQQRIIAAQGPQSRLGAAVRGDRKGKLSLACYAAAIPLAFVARGVSLALYVLVAFVWLVPDRRIEHTLAHESERPGPR
jgi:uncharacterized membrane protein